jgi:hypothetical protein
LPRFLDRPTSSPQLFQPQGNHQTLENPKSEAKVSNFLGVNFHEEEEEEEKYEDTAVREDFIVTPTAD